MSSNKFEQELETMFDLQMKQLEANLNKSHEELKAFLEGKFKGQEQQLSAVFKLEE